MAWVAITKDLVLLAQRQTMLQKLDPLTRTRVLAALLSLIILGCGMMLLAWLGARAVRRYCRRSISEASSGESPEPAAPVVQQGPKASKRDVPDGLEERS